MDSQGGDSEYHKRETYSIIRPLNAKPGKGSENKQCAPNEPCHRRGLNLRKVGKRPCPGPGTKISWQEMAEQVRPAGRAQVDGTW